MRKPFVLPPVDLNEEQLTPVELLAKLKVEFDPKDPKSANKKIYELTRRRGNRTPMPSHRVGRELRFFWSEVRYWQHYVQQQRSAFDASS